MDQTIKVAIKKIQSLKVQGATNIARLVLETLKEEGKRNLRKSQSQYFNFLKSTGRLLAQARPTEPLARNATRFVLSYLEKKAKNLAPEKAQKVLNKACNLFLLLLKHHEKKIELYGSGLIKAKMNVLTHCHSSTVEGILRKAWKKCKKFQIFTTETRPALQGRITARNLLKQGMKVTMVVDSAAEFLISGESGKELMMDLVFLGADAVTSGGSVINKIGSFGISQVAHCEKVPLYVACSLLKTDPETFINKYIAIEIRDKKEVWPTGPKGLKIINFAFDRVPAKFIKGLICEFGIIKPKQVARLVQKNYPWLLKKI